MTLFLVALFVISIAGLSVLFVFKHFELKTGHISFSPEWLHARDAEIERFTRQALRLTLGGCVNSCRKLWQIFITRLRHIVLSVLEKQKKARPVIQTQKNGAGSVYLKQVMEHRDNLRNGNDK